MPATMILAALGVTLTGATLAAATFAINFAVSMIVSRVFGSEVPKQQDNGVRLQVPPSSANAIPIVYGQAYMGGTFVDAALTTNGTTMYYVLAISCISPNGQFTFDTTKMYYGDRLITFDTGSSGTYAQGVATLTDQAGNVDSTINNYLRINLYTSSASGVITNVNNANSPSALMSTGNGLAAGAAWTGTRQMNGLAFAIVSLQYSTTADTTSLQPITFCVSHNLNGTGVAKPGDVWLDYMGSSIYGGAIDSAYLDSASATALNTYSDGLITYTPSGGGSPVTQSRYRINGVLDAGQTVLNNVDLIVMACDSWMAYQAESGKWSLVINKAESTAYAFNDNNIVSDIRVSATDLTNSINQIEAKFPLNANRDQPAFATLYTPSNLLYPNEPTNKYSITYDLVNNSVQAQYLANRLLEQAREDLIVSFSTTFYGIQVDAGNVVSLTNSNYGWTDKLFRVMKVNEASLPDGQLGAQLELSEYNAAVYDDASILEFTPAPNSNLVSSAFFSILSAATILASRPTATIPSFDIQTTTPAIGRVTNINLFYTTVASPAISDWKGLDYYSTPTTTPLAQSTNFQFLNLILPVGTYYFGYIAGNDISQSAISPISASLVWSPTGTAGANGTRTATLSLFQWAASAPTSYPSGTSTYTWATGAFTNPTLNGWTQTPSSGSAGQFLYQIDQIYADQLTTATSSVTWSSSTVLLVGGFGQNGATGSTGATGATGSTGATGATGSAGNSFRIAYLTQSQSAATPAVSPNPTTGSTSFPTSWAGTITTPAAGQSLWAIDGTYVASTNQTTWSAPYLTQGFPTTIQSDNYVLNSAGWQIQRDTGNAYFNALNARGTITGASNITITGQATFNGSNTVGSLTSAVTGNAAYGTDFGIFGASNSILGSGVYGFQDHATAGNGVLGITNASGGNGVRGTNTSTGYGVYSSGKMGTDSQIVSTLAAGTAPLAVTSKTLNTNFNAEYMGSYKWGSVVTAGASTIPIGVAPTAAVTFRWLPIVDTSGTVVGWIPFWVA